MCFLNNRVWKYYLGNKLLKNWLCWLCYLVRMSAPDWCSNMPVLELVTRWGSYLVWRWFGLRGMTSDNLICHFCGQEVAVTDATTTKQFHHLRTNHWTLERKSFRGLLNYLQWWQQKIKKNNHSNKLCWSQKWLIENIVKPPLAFLTETTRPAHFSYK